MTVWLVGPDGKRLVVVAGDEVTETIVLGGSGSISGATVTTSVRSVGGSNTISGAAMTVSDATNRVVTITFTEAQTGALTVSTDPTILTEQVQDIKMVLGTVTTHSEDIHWYARAVVT